jgi:rhodanese-related sulfurtransferase
MAPSQKQTSRWIKLIEKLCNIAIVVCAIALVGALVARYLSAGQYRRTPDAPSSSMNIVSSAPNAEQNMTREIGKAVPSPTGAALPTKLTGSIINETLEFVTEDQVRGAIKIGQRVVILDVRERLDFAAKHLTGARNIPVDEIEVRAINELSPDDLIAVYCGCKDNAAGKVAGKILGLQGFKRITFLHDGSERCDTCP